MDELLPAVPLETFIAATKSNYDVGMAFENRLVSNGVSIIAGIDEAGRGPLAGPVVAAAVILDAGNIPHGLNDSKKLDARKREFLFDEIINNCQVAICTVNAQTIDRVNIRQATLMCMLKAANSLAIKADWYLIDGRDVPDGLKGRASAIIKGDGRSMSIAAASIIAKVARDQMMVRAAKHWPQYGFEKHKGYGTKAHMEAIRQYGPCPLHRLSFAPMAKQKTSEI